HMWPRPSATYTPHLPLYLRLLFPVAAWGSLKLKGHPCHPHAQPWQAAIFIRSKYNCGATLISSRWVLTAAHCLTGPIHVRLGDYNLYAREGTEQYKVVAKSIIHPGYNCTDHDNDIMLLKLQTPATLNRYVQPLGLASQCAEPGEQCLVSGWGTPLNAPGRGARIGAGRVAVPEP
uniref:Peptidase S1 domain-containing protein n=2 Tax=Terrapene triunguis TaxID=2587831 RepID=A0A674J0I1_9SAUR